ELDLADAAAAELDVVGHLFQSDLLLDEALHLPQRVEDAVVQVLAIDERREYLVENVALVLGARDEPRLDVGIALPVAAVAHEIRLERRHADGERAALAEGPQARVDAIDEAVARDLVEQLDQELRQLDEVGLGVRVLVLARVFTGFRKQEHEVDVRREIELAAAELAHAEHEQRQRPPIGAARRLAAAQPEALGGVTRSDADQRVGNGRGL